MKRSKEHAGKRRGGVQLLTLYISTAMVLVLIGMVVFSVLTSRNLSRWVRENLAVTVLLNDDVTVDGAKVLSRDLQLRPFAKQLTYISREQALKEQTEAMGSDPSEFLGANPFPASLEMQLHSDYANRDSLHWITEELLQDKRVADVVYPVDLMDSVNSNLAKVNLVLLVVALLLTIVSFTLINNTVRLSVYSRRFLIHTMKLVGASWGFIRRPFIRQALIVGIVSALLALMVLGSIAYSLYFYEPDVVKIITWRELTFTGCAVLLFGIVITLTCSWISVNKFLRMSAGEIYKI